MTHRGLRRLGRLAWLLFYCDFVALVLDRLPPLLQLLIHVFNNGHQVGLHFEQFRVGLRYSWLHIVAVFGGRHGVELGQIEGRRYVQ